MTKIEAETEHGKKVYEVDVNAANGEITDVEKERV